MSIYSTINISRERARQEIMRRVLMASDEDLENMLFAVTRSYSDALHFNNFLVGYDEPESTEETE